MASAARGSDAGELLRPRDPLVKIRDPEQQVIGRRTTSFDVHTRRSFSPNTPQCYSKRSVLSEHDSLAPDYDV